MTVIDSIPRQLPLSVRLDDSATFDNFYLDKGNAREPADAGSANLNAHIIAALKSAGGGDFLYLWGLNGAGCSHLLQACCHWFSQQSIYLPLEQFISADPAEVLADLEQMPMVILDDLEKIIDWPNWAEQLFHLYNRLQDKKGILVVSANVPPAAIETPLADLKSRLSAMQVHKVGALEDGAKAAALIHRAANRGMNMPETVAQYLLTHYSRHMGGQIQLLEQLDFASLETQRKLTIPLVKEVLDVTRQPEVDVCKTTT